MLQLFRILALATATFGLALPAVAQTAPSPLPNVTTSPAGASQRHHRGSRGNRYLAAVRALNLTSDQRSRIDAIVAAHRTRPTDPAARRADRQAMRTAIQGVLTPAQIQSLRTQAAARRARNGAQGSGATT